MKKKFSLLGDATLAWFVLFLIGPVLIVFITSFLTRGTYGGTEWKFSFDSYGRSFSAIYLKILFSSIKLAAVTTISCLLVAYPMAWAMATAGEKKRNIYVMLVSIPFLMNLIIRVYSLRLFTGFDGPLIKILDAFNLNVDPYSFSQNRYLVFYGMLTTYLPFMVFSLYSALEKFDFTLVEAVYDLGGSSWTALQRVLLPNTKKAITNGCILVFVPSVGEFVIPDLLGGAKTMLIGNLITEQFLKARDWPFGAALTILLILILAVFCVLLNWWSSPKALQKK